MLIHFKDKVVCDDNSLKEGLELLHNFQATDPKMPTRAPEIDALFKLVSHGTDKEVNLYSNLAILAHALVDSKVSAKVEIRKNPRTNKLMEHYRSTDLYFCLYPSHLRNDIDVTPITHDRSRLLQLFFIYRLRNLSKQILVYIQEEKELKAITNDFAHCYRHLMVLCSQFKLDHQLFYEEVQPILSKLAKACDKETFHLKNKIVSKIFKKSYEKKYDRMKNHLSEFEYEPKSSEDLLALWMYCFYNDQMPEDKDYKAGISQAIYLIKHKGKDEEAYQVS